MQFLKNNVTFLHRIVCNLHRKNLISLEDCFSKLRAKIYEYLNFIT